MSGFSPASRCRTPPEVGAFLGTHRVGARLPACGSSGQMVEAGRQKTGRGLRDRQLVLVGPRADAVDDFGVEAEHRQAHGS